VGALSLLGMGWAGKGGQEYRRKGGGYEGRRRIQTKKRFGKRLKGGGVKMHFKKKKNQMKGK